MQGLLYVLCADKLRDCKSYIYVVICEPNPTKASVNFRFFCCTICILLIVSAQHSFQQLSPEANGPSTPRGSSPEVLDVGNGFTKQAISCASSVNGDSSVARRSAGGRIVRRCSPTVDISQHADDKKTPLDADPTTMTSRIGRMIKKPVRLEDQVAMQMLSPRNGRDGPWRAAAREAAARVAALAAGTSVSNSSATTLLLNGRQPSASSEANVDREKKSGTERIIARLGTSFGGGGAVTGSSTSTVRGWHGRSWGDSSSSELGKRSRGHANVNGTNASLDGMNGSGAGSGNDLDGSTGFSEKKNVRRTLPGSACRGSAGDEVEVHGAACEAPAASSASGDGGSSNSGGGGGGTTLKKSGWGGQMIVPYPPPPRPVGVGTNPEETIKEYRRSFDDVRVPVLVSRRFVRVCCGSCCGSISSKAIDMFSTTEICRGSPRLTFVFCGETFSGGVTFSCRLWNAFWVGYLAGVGRRARME